MPPDGKAAPAVQKAKRTPLETEFRLLTAAEAVFGKRGYIDATVDDVVALAGVSRGAFYLYFKNKDDIFIKLVSRVMEEMLGATHAPVDGSFRTRVEAANRRYLELFRKHRLILKSLYQVGSANAAVARMHAAMRSRFILRMQKHFDLNVARGHSPKMDTRIAAYALGLMVEGTAHAWLALEFDPFEEPIGFEAAVKELTNLWCRAVYKDGTGSFDPYNRPGAPSEDEVSSRKRPRTK